MYRQLDHRIASEEVCHVLAIMYTVLGHGFLILVFPCDNVRGKALVSLIECICIPTVAYLCVTFWGAGRFRLVYGLLYIL